ncbi:acetyl-CoA carboxylase carboxyl transferase subunit alpha [candidate division bacterium WOR-3 4484_18]|uniref:Acetyl-coenzyme A carboxylase carboxyl transferase subunit alpha n=1 Tax=candidate division WOR-3 bacterium 4484_18 TaxID=2020626 RepID=A0A257LVJ3_UNCW3|nr:MAG: acetyl-CoA carboxylase carboxyl transferase subunit alpha [candidate division bacterium WOR-3 4484_18]
MAKYLDFEEPIVKIENRIKELELIKDEAGVQEELDRLRAELQRLYREIYASLTPWQRVMLARHPDRPYTLDYIKLMTEDFIELHGDRRFGDDPAVITGLAIIDGEKIILVGQEKGRTTRDKIVRNFGMMHPEGYRKALKVMKLGEKFHRPVLTLIDTPGAYPGIGAEERGQAEAIAYNLREMASLRTPIVAVVTGEGGSGGALGIGIADRVYMLENAFYSVISPEGCAAILWRDAAKAPEAAAALKITAQDLLELGVIDGIIPEPLGGAHRNPKETAENIKKVVLDAFRELKKLPPHELVRKRREKYQRMGVIKIEDTQTTQN